MDYATYHLLKFLKEPENSIDLLSVFGWFYFGDEIHPLGGISPTYISYSLLWSLRAGYSLGGGSKYVSFSPLLGEMIQFD